MGLFSSISKVVGKVLGSDAFSNVASVAAPVIGGLIGADGAREANSANAALARENRDWQERMANTAHQREMADLKAAGLNPILTAKFGGSATPPGNVAQMNNSMEPVAGGLSSAVQVRMQNALNREQILTQRSVQSVNSAQAMASRAQAIASRAAAIKTLIEAQKTKGEIKGLRYDNRNKDIVDRSRSKNPKFQEWRQGLKDIIDAGTPKLFPH